jgi:predicted nucleotidyltransferase
MSLEGVVKVLDHAGVAYAVIGAAALAARGAARSTLDVDLLTTDRAVLTSSFWSLSSDVGDAIDVRKGDADDPLAGVVRIQGREPIDIVVGKYIWQRDVVQRAERLTVRGVSLPVVRRSDLILLKLFAGGYGDLHDVFRLLEVADRAETIAQVTHDLESLPREMRERWRQLLEQSGNAG